MEHLDDSNMFLWIDPQSRRGVLNSHQYQPLILNVLDKTFDKTTTSLQKQLTTWPGQPWESIVRRGR